MEPGRFPLRARLGMWALSLTLVACTDREFPTAAPTPHHGPSMSIAGDGSRPLTLGNAKLWIGLKNSDDVGLRLDMRAEVLLNGVVVGSGELLDVPGGSSGFNNAVLRTIGLAMTGAVSVPPGAVLNFRPSVRRTCIGTGQKSGTVRFWYDGPAIDQGTTRNAGSRFAATVGTESSDYFMRNPATLSVDAGTARQFADVAVNSTAACPARPFSSLGEWSLSVAMSVGAPAAMIALSNADQIATAGSAVAEPPSVRVVDAWGNPVAGVTVTFTPAPVGSVIGSPATTDANGVATAGRWTLGTIVGDMPERVQTVTATAGTLNQTFTGKAVAGPASSISLEPPEATIKGGESQTFTAIVQDVYGNPLYTQPVITWTSLHPSVAVVPDPGLSQSPAGSASSTMTVTARNVPTDTGAIITASFNPSLGGAGARLSVKSVRPLAVDDTFNIIETCTDYNAGNCYQIEPIGFDGNVLLANGQAADYLGEPAAVVTRFQVADRPGEWYAAGQTALVGEGLIFSQVTVESDGKLTYRRLPLYSTMPSVSSVFVIYELRNTFGASGAVAELKFSW